MRQCVLGEDVRRPAKMDSALCEELFSLALSIPDPIPVVKGKTVCAYDFYEGLFHLTNL